MDKEMDRKFLDRFAKLMEEQTIEPTKKDVAAVVNKFYSEQKQNKKLAAVANVLDDEPKKKRQLTEYNIFMREQMSILKEREAEMEKTDHMTAIEKMQYIGRLWTEKKGGVIVDDDEDK